MNDDQGKLCGYEQYSVESCIDNQISNISIQQTLVDIISGKEVCFNYLL
jgi:hypothetical protein